MQKNAIIYVRYLLVFVISALPVFANAEMYLGGNLSQMHFKAVNASAEDNNTDLDFHQFRMDDAERITVLLGIDPASSWRMDFELTRQLEQSTSKVTQAVSNSGGPGNVGAIGVETSYANTLLMYNNYMDFDLTGKLENFSPYVGLGVGVVQHDVSDLSVINGSSGATLKSEKSTDFAWQLKLGGAYQLSGGAAVDISASYLDAGTAESDKTALGIQDFKEPFRWDVRGWVFGVGIRAPL